MGYKRAGINDIDILTQLRLESLRTTNRLAADTDLSKVAEETRRYYETRFEQDQHAAWLVYDRDCAIAAGGISFYQVMPTYHNSTGERACIMNMYVHPDYPNKEITMKLLDLLVEEAKERGIHFITLEATAV